jgi:hypothetical protein
MSMSIDDALDDLLAPVEGESANAIPRRDRDAMWRPGVEWKGDEGTLTTSAAAGDAHPDWSHVLAVWDLDPDKFAVVEPVLFNAWDAPGSEGAILRMRQWKARVVRRRGDVGPDIDVEKLLADVLKAKPAKPAPMGEGVFHVVLGDWQIGKPDGDGLRGTVLRIQQAIIDVERRVRDLRKLGRPLGTLMVEWTGDSVEGCVGFYAMQTFGVELDRREQMKVTRRLLRDALMRWSRLFDEVIVLAVGGNHGENRGRSGKAYTSFGDNDDLAVVEQVAEILAVNPDTFGHVKIVIPPDHLTVTAMAAGWIVGVTHGHVARESGSAEAKLRRWYERAAGGKQPVGDADILVTGHYHHMRVADWGGCIWVQCPALDGGSEWWTQTRGESSMPGVLTFASYPQVRLADLMIL